MELDARPIPPHSRQEWLDRSQPPVTGFSSANPPQPPTFIPSSSSLSQRRRSSVLHTRPAGPPPNLPIPSVPGTSANSEQLYSHSEALEDFSPAPNPHNREYRSGSLARSGVPPPSLGANAFPPTHHASSSTRSPHLSTPSSTEELSDTLAQPAVNPSHHTDRHRDAAIDRQLLSPTENRSEQRPSSRRALTRALELAREAVHLDTTNDNPEAAVNAYAQSVALLSEVMERVRRGEDGNESHRRRRRRSVAAQEEEVRRLQNIHDTYADRMNILSIIYSIPAVPYPISSAYSSATPSATSTTSTSPTNSASPSSDSSPQLTHASHVANQIQEPQYRTEDLSSHNEDYQHGHSLALDESVLAGVAVPSIPHSSQHPYASQTFHPTPSRTSPIHSRRPRAPSNLPPLPPPPTNALPPAPSSSVTEPPMPSPSLQMSNRYDSLTAAREHFELTAGHQRSGSGLMALEEEKEENRPDAQSPTRDSMDNKHGIPDTPRTSKHDSHPLPPIPSPTSNHSNSPGTPRTTMSLKPPPSPRLINNAARPRGASQLTTRSELANQNIINPTTTQGTIYQRRSTKSSVPSNSRPASPAESTVSNGSIPPPPKFATPSLPITAPSSGLRSRSSSQPGPRPSNIGGRVSPLDQRPPLPNGVVPNIPTARKPSFPSKLNPAPSPSQLSVQTTDIVPQLGLQTLIIPQSIVTGNLPTTPISPLPPIAPPDPLLKPYHMMHLLQITMTSPTGGYITRRLHVPCEVWSQGGAKLSNLAEKVRVVGILCSALEDLSLSSVDSFGAGNVCSGLALGIGSVGRKEADAWLAKLEEFSNVCDGVVANFGKKLSVGEGFVLKKTTWGDKLTRKFDKFTNGKNLDSPAAYVQGLKKLFVLAQLLDEHTRAVLSQPIAPAYAAFPVDIRASAEQKLKHSSEFFASVVLTFVIQDLSLLLDKYAKKCEKWLAE